MAEPRYCRMLVLSARVRNEEHLEHYRPFNGEPLVDLFVKAARTVAASRRRPSFDRHAVFPYFFFGRDTLDAWLKEELRQLPSSMLDCDIYRSTESGALAIAGNALFEFGYEEPGKTLVFVCGDQCQKAPEYNHFPATNDAELYAFLFSDLAGNAFAEIGKALVDGS